MASGRVGATGPTVRVHVQGLAQFRRKAAGLSGSAAWFKAAHEHVAKLDLGREQKYLIEEIAKTGRRNNSGRLAEAIVDPRNFEAKASGYTLNTFLASSPAKLYYRAIEHGLSAGFVGRVLYGGFSTATGGGRPFAAPGGNRLYKPSQRSRRTAPTFISTPGTRGPSVGYGTIKTPIRPHRYAERTRASIVKAGAERLVEAYRREFPPQYKGMLPAPRKR